MWVILCFGETSKTVLIRIHEAAIACNLATGMSLKRAVGAAGRYVEAGIKTSTNRGKGSGPINHFHSLSIMPFPPYVCCEASESQTTDFVWVEVVSSATYSTDQMLQESGANSLTTRL